MSFIEASVYGRIIMAARYCPDEEGDFLITIIGVPADPAGITMVIASYFGDDAEELAAELTAGASVVMHGDMSVGENIHAGNGPKREDPWIFVSDSSYSLRLYADEVEFYDDDMPVAEALDEEYEALIQMLGVEPVVTEELLAELEAEMAKSTIH
jgi:hypothetical protein